LFVFFDCLSTLCSQLLLTETFFPLSAAVASASAASPGSLISFYSVFKLHSVDRSQRALN
ncbi:MAG: hypothetical protein KH436_06710, partial [Firmicutes bacterium]|nr:hypothetical protein [Bacillota bacterium]